MCACVCVVLQVTGMFESWVPKLVSALYERVPDANVIVVDWNKGAANLNYFTAVAYTREAAQNLTGFIMTMEVRGEADGKIRQLS